MIWRMEIADFITMAQTLKEKLIEVASLNFIFRFILSAHRFTMSVPSPSDYSTFDSYAPAVFEVHNIDIYVTCWSYTFISRYKIKMIFVLQWQLWWVWGYRAHVNSRSLIDHLQTLVFYDHWITFDIEVSYWLICLRKAKFTRHHIR